MILHARSQYIVTFSVGDDFDGETMQEEVLRDMKVNIE
jgi:hypothetical protein